MNNNDLIYGKLLYFIYLDNNTFIKNQNISELKKYDETKCIFYFSNYKEKNGKIKYYFTFLDYNISFIDFPWISYIKLNGDLTNYGLITKQDAWSHWINYGIKEKRTYTCINNSNFHKGRLGNIFFINMFLHFMSEKYNLKCKYKFLKEFNSLGIKFNKGTEIYKTNCLVTDHNFTSILKSDNYEHSNLIISEAWFQTEEFCEILKKHFEKDKIKNRIINNNVYKYRYNNNNDLFIHIRLGDVSKITNIKIKKYIKLLNKLNYDYGFISSDSINNPICKYLIEKYKLKIVDYDEVTTIMFGSTCNNIILSGGTFSWLIGFFAFLSSNIYYYDIENKWYGNIFSFPNWNKI